MPSFQRTPPTQAIHQLVTPLIAVRNGREEYVSGSAFLIGRGLALTAYHVIEDFFIRYEEHIPSTGNLEMSFEILGYFLLDDERALTVKVMRMWRIPPLDIAVLSVGVPEDWPEDFKWTAMAMDLLPPPVGTPLAAFGFADGSVETASDQSPATVSIHSSTATGQVIEIHHQLRDTARLPFPCFRTNMQFDGGMSGGPVLNNRTGRVCGVICSSLPATRDNTEHITYASSLWPVVMTLVDSQLEDGVTESFPLLDLFENGSLQAINLDCVDVIRRSDGTISARANYASANWDNPHSASE